MTATVLPLPPAFAKSRALRPLLEKAGEWAAEQLEQFDRFDWPSPLTLEWHRIANSFQDELVGLRLRDEYAAADGVFTRSQLGERLVFTNELLKILSAQIDHAADERSRRFATAPAPIWRKNSP